MTCTAKKKTFGRWAEGSPLTQKITSGLFVVVLVKTLRIKIKEKSKKVRFAV
jgi:hypothetical protein